MCLKMIFDMFLGVMVVFFRIFLMIVEFKLWMGMVDKVLLKEFRIEGKVIEEEGYFCLGVCVVCRGVEWIE